MNRRLIRLMGMGAAVWSTIFNRAHAYEVIRSGVEVGVGYDYIVPSAKMSGYSITNFYLESWWTCSGSRNAQIGGGNYYYGHDVAWCGGYYMCDSTGFFCSDQTSAPTSSVYCCQTSGSSACPCDGNTIGSYSAGNKTWTQYEFDNQYYIIKGCASGLYYDETLCSTGANAWSNIFYSEPMGYSNLWDYNAAMNCCYPCPNPTSGFDENSAEFLGWMDALYSDDDYSGNYYNCTTSDFFNRTDTGDWCWTAHSMDETGGYTSNGRSACRVYPVPNNTTFDDGKGIYTLGDGCPWQE